MSRGVYLLVVALLLSGCYMREPEHLQWGNGPSRNLTHLLEPEPRYFIEADGTVTVTSTWSSGAVEVTTGRLNSYTTSELLLSSEFREWFAKARVGQLHEFRESDGGCNTCAVMYQKVSDTEVARAQPHACTLLACFTARDIIKVK